MAGARQVLPAVPSPIENQPDRDVGVVDLYVVIASGGEHVRGLRLQTDQVLLNLGTRPSPILCLAVWIALIVSSAAKVSKPGCRSKGVRGG